MYDQTHASFFSGVGGLDLGLERAGWRTVSFSEIDPYASAVLAERWPGVPNLGSIVQLASGSGRGADLRAGYNGSPVNDPDGWSAATLWTGGFPCQDLSVAGKRRGMGEGTRSGLAYSFLALAERHRPRFVLLENVPGLLSSHGGRDMAALIGALVELGYGVGYRVLDARYFGVPQRRRRVFILGVSPGGRAGAERAAEVLSVGSRCRRHPPTGIEAGEGVAERVGVGISHALSVPTSTGRNDPNGEDFIVGPIDTARVSPSPDPGRVRAADGLAGRLDGGVQVDGSEQAATLRGFGHGWQGQHNSTNAILAPTLRVGPQDGGPGDTVPIIASTLNSGGNNGGFRTEPGQHLVTGYRKSARPTETDGVERWVEDGLANTLNAFDTGDIRSTHIALGEGPADDPLLPLGLDSHRYRCCGNGVVSSVSEWVGLRLAVLGTPGGAE